MRAWLLRPQAKAVLAGVCALPVVWLFFAAFQDRLGPNPAEALIRGTGDWTLRALCLVLAVTPLRLITRTPALARFRRLLGLNVFAYATLHLLCMAFALRPWFFPVVSDNFRVDRVKLLTDIAGEGKICLPIFIL